MLNTTTMKNLLLGGCLLMATASFTQATLFADDFESGSSQWSLNTGSGANNWMVNNAYLGFSGLIPDTPDQPGSFTNGPQSTYMHITNTTICGGLSVCNANFDTGSASNQNTEVATSIDASSYTNVTVSFWYLCAGQTSTSYGTMEYSLNGGSTWIAIATEYSGVSTWTQETVTMPAWDNAGAFKVRFKWQNGGGGLDPAFSIDELSIIGTLGGSNTITTTNDLSPASWCEGFTITGMVNFVSTGTYNPTNTYSAELSDASGSFAAPMIIGTLNSSASGALSIGAVVSGSTPAGSGYRIRVTASDPITTGTDNGADLSIFTLPTVTQSSLSDVCIDNGLVTLAGGLPSGGSYTGTGVSTGLFDPSVAGSGTHGITYYYIDANGCDGSAVETITVNDLPTTDLSSFANVCVTEAAFTLTGGTPASGTYSGMFDPAAAGTGTHTITYSYTDANGCTGSTTQAILVDGCLSLDEEMLLSVMIYPNPTEATFSITTPVDEVVITDMNGRIVKSFGNQTNYDISELKQGIYMVRIVTNGTQLLRRVILNK
jgi:hypothetical protein